MLLIELIHDRLGRFDDLHAPWRVGVTADGYRVIFDRQVNIGTIYGCDGFRCQLLRYMFLHVFEFPGPSKDVSQGISAERRKIQG